MAEHLHLKGVQLAIDDFGTGNSSLSWLEKLRPDVLKIDRSFTSSVGIDSVNATVTDIIIALADRLNIVTVAEGVETLEQESYLRATASMCCRGFYYARPMPIEAFPAWLADREGQKSEGRIARRATGADEQGNYSSSSLSGRVTTARTRSTR